MLRSSPKRTHVFMRQSPALVCDMPSNSSDEVAVIGQISSRTPRVLACDPAYRSGYTRPTSGFFDVAALYGSMRIEPPQCAMFVSCANGPLNPRDLLAPMKRGERIIHFLVFMDHLRSPISEIVKERLQQSLSDKTELGMLLACRRPFANVTSSKHATNEIVRAKRISMTPILRATDIEILGALL